MGLRRLHLPPFDDVIDVFIRLQVMTSKPPLRYASVSSSAMSPFPLITLSSPRVDIVLKGLSTTFLLPSPVRLFKCNKNTALLLHSCIDPYVLHFRLMAVEIINSCKVPRYVNIRPEKISWVLRKFNYYDWKLLFGSILQSKEGSSRLLILIGLVDLESNIGFAESAFAQARAFLECATFLKGWL